MPTLGVPVARCHAPRQGAGAPLSGLVAMLAALAQLSAAPAAGYSKRLVFAALAGEPWGYMGSRRLLWEAASGSNATAGLDISRVQQVWAGVGCAGSGPGSTAEQARLDIQWLCSHGRCGRMHLRAH
jgi:hypothetical protein